MTTGAAKVLALSVVLVTLVAAGCAKRPAMSTASAPAPTGTTAAATAPLPAAPQRKAPARTAQRSTAGSQMATAGRPTASEFRESAELKDVHFDFDRYEIRKPDAELLDADASWLKSHGDELVLIEGHADERGTNEYNLALGERRAKSTMDYLVSRGIQSSRITVTSYGEERPVCREHNESCWSKNRRAHFLVKPK